MRFLKFTLIGGICTFIDFFMFSNLINSKLGVVPANIISYSVGLSINFVFMRIWVFKDVSKIEVETNKLITVFSGGFVNSATNVLNRFMIFMFCGYLGLILNTLILWVLSNKFEPIIAKMLATLTVLIYNYYANKLIIFRVKDE